MTDRPILFSDPMVRALLDGRKTQTRRVAHDSIVRPLDALPSEIQEDLELRGWIVVGDHMFKSPCRPGDRLWAREAWQYSDWTEDGEPFIRFRADEAEILSRPDPDWAERLEDIWCHLSREENYGIDNRAADRRWRTPLFMPRWASRITLIVTDVRVQRVQEISEDDAIAEGWPGPVTELGFPVAKPLNWYERLWDSINAKRPGCSWADNPFVAAISFRVIPKNIDQIAEAS